MTNEADTTTKTKDRGQSQQHPTACKGGLVPKSMHAALSTRLQLDNCGGRAHAAGCHLFLRLWEWNISWVEVCACVSVSHHARMYVCKQACVNVCMHV